MNYTASRTDKLGDLVGELSSQGNDELHARIRAYPTLWALSALTRLR